MRTSLHSGSSVSHHSGKSPLIDNHGRTINYLRLAITDRCNLRCSYCMPEEGVDNISHDETMSYEELERLVRIFLELGVEKVRLTGGEPFVRKGCMDFLERLKHELGVKHLVITTNGVETARHIERLKKLPISGINLSLDTLNRARFKEISRRDRLEQVLDTLHKALAADIAVKVNSVVTEETSDQDIHDLGMLAHKNKLSLRFIELMPFSGEHGSGKQIDYALRERLNSLFPGLQECPAEVASTAKEFTVPGFTGTLGIIEGHSRNFCSTCNKIRITPQGILKACLYDNGVLDLKSMLRDSAADGEIMDEIRSCLNKRFANGLDTEKVHKRADQPSMATIGG